MAKQVEDILLRLGISGFEGLDRVKSSFRDLGRVTNLAERDILKARDSLNDFAKKAGDTEAVNKGLIEAFKGLRSQVDVNSATYRNFTNDITRLETELRGSTAAIDRQRLSLLNNAAAGKQNVDSLQRQVDALRQLQRETRPGSSAFLQLGKDIDNVTVKLGKLKSEAQAFNLALGQQAGATPEVLNRQIATLQKGLQSVRYDAEQFVDTLRKIQLLQITQTGRAGRAGVIAGFEAFRSREYTAGYADPSRLAAMPDTTAALNQELAELSLQLSNVERNSVRYLQVAMQMAGVQRELTSVTQGYAQSLLMGIRTGTVSPSARNLQEVVSALRAEMAQLDTTTTEGARAYADNAREANALEKRLRDLAGAYRTVSETATQAATAEQSAANARTRNLYFNNTAVLRQEQALTELGQRIRQGVAGTPLLLPAAGQTTAPGTGAAISGGARRLVSGQTETVFGAPGIRGAAQQAGLPSAAVGVPAAVGMISDAYAKQARDAFKASESLDSYFVAISKATQGSNNSINSLNKQRQAWEDLRNAIPRTYKLYGEAGAEIQKLDKQLERSQLQRRRLSGMQMAQGVGAALSGGIFGGPEGLIGGLGGLAIGGVGGAFAGAAAGAQVGMLRQQLGLVAQYVAQLNLAKTTLAQASTGQADYNNMLMAARRISADYAVTLQDTLRGYAQVAVAARANGLGAKEIEEVYRGVIAAGVAFGKSQADLDAIVTATVQVLSKGKVSAEELGGQIGERLPGAVAKFAAATGRTLPELAKALEDGKVNIRDFVKFAQQQFTDYDSIARLIGDSPEKAGVRVRIALDTVAETYGSFLQNSGATFQDAAGHILGWVIANEGGIKRFLAALSLFGKDLITLLKPIAQITVNILKPVFSFIFQNAARGIAALRTSLEALQQTDFAGASARAQKAVEQLYPNPLERALKGAQAYQEALNVELQMINKRFGSSYTERLDTEAARLFKQFQPSQYGTPGAGAAAAAGTGTAADKEAEKAAKKARKDLFNELLDQLNAQNKVLAQQGRLNESVAETESAKAAAALLTAQDILRNEQAQLDLRLKFGEISKRVYSEQQQAIRLEGQVVRQEFDKTVKKLQEEADSLLRGLTGPGGTAAPTESPFQRASRELTEEIQRRQARAAQIGGLRGERASKGLAAIDVREAATRTVLGDEATGLEAQIRDLQRMGRELSTLDQLKEKYLQDWDSLDPKLKQQLTTMAAQKDALTRQKESLSQLKQLYADIGMSIKDGVVGAIQGAIDGTKSLQQVATDLLNSIANKLLDVAVNMALFGVMSGTGTGGGLLGGLFKSANGSAYASNKIVPYAMGGLVTKPTLFRYANGGIPATGLMGEAGPEAIMPLRRLPNGRLGVESSSGSAPININVNVDAKGTSVEGSEGQGKALAAVISAGVQAEIVKQQRPGGLLNR